MLTIPGIQITVTKELVPRGLAGCLPLNTLVDPQRIISNDTIVNWLRSAEPRSAYPQAIFC